jgi:hypothetical protein
LNGLRREQFPWMRRPDPLIYHEGLVLEVLEMGGLLGGGASSIEVAPVADAASARGHVIAAGHVNPLIVVKQGVFIHAQGDHRQGVIESPGARDEVGGGGDRTLGSRDIGPGPHHGGLLDRGRRQVAWGAVTGAGDKRDLVRFRAAVIHRNGVGVTEGGITVGQQGAVL